MRDDADQLYDIDSQRRKTDRRQALLREKIAKEKGLHHTEVDSVDGAAPDEDAARAADPDQDGNPYHDTVDNLPVKRK